MKNIIILLFLAVAGLLVSTHATAQEKKKHEYVLLHPDKFYRKYMPRLHVKRDPPDSLFIKAYPNYLSLGAHVLSPAIDINLKSRLSSSGASRFRTNITDILGFSVSYRLVTAGFAFLTRSGINTHDDYAPSHYGTATIKYNSTAYAFQFKYLRIKGFTDVNPANRYDLSRNFRQRPDIVNKEFQFENIYNFSWRKYSYVAPLTFSQRQMKTHGGFLLKAGVYYNQFSGDSSLITKSQQKYYDNFGAVTSIRSFSLRLAPGYGRNIVFKNRVYIALAAFTSYDLAFYKYLATPKEKIPSKIAGIFALNGQASIGYQSRRLYSGLRLEAEQRTGALRGVSLNTMYTYFGIEFGYRFDAPAFVKKVYKETMPPGM